MIIFTISVFGDFKIIVGIQYFVGEIISKNYRFTSFH
jgi:hypothetical protein